MGLMVAVPVPVFAASGLAMPLPSIVYRVAVGVAASTQSIAVQVPGLRAVAADTARAAPRGSIRLAAEELGAASAPLDSASPQIEHASEGDHPQPDARVSRVAKAAKGSAPDGARARSDPGNTEALEPAASAETGDPAPIGRDKHDPRASQTPPGSEAREEAKSDLVSRDEPKGEPSSSTPAHPSEQPKANPGKEDSKGGSDPTPTSPPPPQPPPPLPPVLSPPPPLPPTLLPPVDPLPSPVSLTPDAHLDSIADDLREIVGARGGTSGGDRVEQALDKVESASGRLANIVPDNQGAIGDIRNAIQKLDDALEEGGVSFLEHTDLVARLREVAALLDSRTGGPQ